MHGYNAETISTDLEVVTAAVQSLGFSHISPESLEALGDNMDGQLDSVRRAYRNVMGGFRALLAPVEA
jgi:hypothetical protein